eukprot:m.43432 g.43432  ORF g.43432 m.43432 type:complete len:1080 (-) comp6406_c0_seq1:140-3379(-)
MGSGSAKRKYALPGLILAHAAAVCATVTPVDVFRNGEPAPGLPFPSYSYNFGIPVLVNTGQRSSSGGALLAFAQAYLKTNHTAQDPPHRVGVSSTDGDDGWIDIVMRRSVDGGVTWDANLTVICRNSSLASGVRHSCQQPTPVVDYEVGKVFLMSSLDNWHVRLQESDDDGVSWTPWADARDLDSSLRRPGWGLVFTGLPGGIQLQWPSKYAGRLVLCSSAYWSGGEMDPTGRIVKAGDVLSRYSYSIISDDHGATWRIGSGGQIQPRHTTECSVVQAFTGQGEVYIYSRIWDKTCRGCLGYGRGIAMSVDGGETFDNATLRGLPDTTPDVEGSIASTLVTTTDTATGEATNMTCFYVSSPWSTTRANLTVLESCGAIDAWSNGQVVDAGPSSYSSLGVTYGPINNATLVNLWAWGQPPWGTSASAATTTDTNVQSRATIGGIRFAVVRPIPVAFSPIATPAMASGTATTEQGTVVGTVENGFAVYRGIPYAQPPVDELRLPPPADPKPYESGTWNATEFAPTCLQDHGWPSEQGANTSSEDCLYLNIYQPLQSSQANGSLPVMVYFPAGEFLVGSSNDLENNWPFSPNVILVTVNYRLGWLGFAAMDELRNLSSTNSTGNMGMQDQRAALQWLKQNVAAFNGDPTRITIFGESSGGSSVGYHLANPRSWGLFQRAIGESPGLSQVRTLHDASLNTNYLLALLAQNGSAGCVQKKASVYERFPSMRITSPVIQTLNKCEIDIATGACSLNEECFGFTVPTPQGNASRTCYLHAEGIPAYGGDTYANWTTYVRSVDKRFDGVAQCLMQADPEAMIASGFGSRYGPRTSNLVTDMWAPVIDGVEMSESMLISLKNGSVAPGVPVLMGANKDEASTWMGHDLPPPFLTCGNTTQDALTAWCVAMFGPTIGPQLPTLYTYLDEPLTTCSNGDVDKYYVAAARILRDYTITCPIEEVLAQVQAGAYMYYFTVTPTTSVNVPNPAYLPKIGAFHGAEVPFVFNDTFELATPAERTLSSIMGCMWANFATSGNPNIGPDCGLSSPLPVWPAWTPANGTALVLNTTIRNATLFATDRCAALGHVPPP